MSHLGIFLRKQQVSPNSIPTSSLQKSGHPRCQPIIGTAPTSSDLTDEPRLERVSSALSFSDDDDDEDWKRDVAIATSPSHSTGSQGDPLPIPPPPLNSLEPIPSVDSSESSGRLSLAVQKPLKRVSSSNAIWSFPSSPVQAARRRTYSEATPISHSKGRNRANSHRRLKSFSAQEMQEVGDLQDLDDLKTIESTCSSPRLNRGHRRSDSVPESPRRLPSLANVSGLVHDFDSLSRILAQRRTKFGNFHVKVGITWNQIGNYHFRCHEFENALIAYKEALECKDGSNDPMEFEHLASAYANIGTVLWSAGRADESIVPLRKAVELRIHYEVSQGRDHDRCLAVADCQYQLGLALTLAQEYDESLDVLHKALLIRKRMAGHKFWILLERNCKNNHCSN